MSLSRKDKGPAGDLSPYVPDTSAILTGKIDLLSMNCVLPSAVLGEIRKGKMGRIMENSAFNVRIMSPSGTFLNRIAEAARLTGDLPFLSQVDMEILAVALEIHGKVISDDYSMQNVCSSMGIEYMGCGIDSIKSNITWGYVCKGCGAKFENMIAECRVCGHNITRYPLNQDRARSQ